MTDAVEEPTPPNSDIDSQTTWGIGEVFLGLVAMLMFSLILVSAYRYFAGLTSPHAITFGEVIASFIGGWLCFGGTAYLVSGRSMKGLQDKLGFRFVLPVDIYKGVGVGLAAQLMVSVIYLPLTLTNSKLGKTISDPAQSLTHVAHGWRWIPFAFGVCIITPICEELFFRGVTLRAFAAKWGPSVGIIASGILFGFAHFEGIQTPALIIFGWILAWRATKTGRIGETIFAHGTFNAFTLVVLAWPK